MENEEKTILVEKQNEVNLPGAWVMFKAAVSSGYRQNEFGVGQMSLELYRPGLDWPWIDLGHIYFSSPTPEQLLDAQTSGAFSEGHKAYVNIQRRLSKKQAELVVKKIAAMINLEFPNGIPPDDEITL